MASGIPSSRSHTSTICRAGCGVHGQVGVDGGRPIEEEADGRGEIVAVAMGRQRGHSEHLLPWSSQWLSRCGQHLHGRAAAEHCEHDVGGIVEELLAVVDDE